VEVKQEEVMGLLLLELQILAVVAVLVIMLELQLSKELAEQVDRAL